MKEFIVTSHVYTCAGLYWLGGQELPFVNRGYKAIRRFGVPLVVLSMTLYLGAVWYLALLASGLLCAALHLGYKNKVWLYALTGLAMGAPALLLGTFDSWCIMAALWPCIAHTLFGLLSLKENRFGWSFVALLQGLAIGVAYATQFTR